MPALATVHHSPAARHVHVGEAYIHDCRQYGQDSRGRWRNRPSRGKPCGWLACPSAAYGSGSSMNRSNPQRSIGRTPFFPRYISSTTAGWDRPPLCSPKRIYSNLQCTPRLAHALSGGDRPPLSIPHLVWSSPSVRPFGLGSTPIIPPPHTHTRYPLDRCMFTIPHRWLCN